jgi:hypothetical protein
MWAFLVLAAVACGIYRYKNQITLVCGLRYISKREDYIWEYRNKLPSFIARIMDHFFMVDTEWAVLNSWKHPKDSIKIVQASLFTWNKCVDVTVDLQKQIDQFKKFEEKKTISIDSLDPTYGTWSMDICYKGHSDKKKHTPASEYYVRYSGCTDINGNHFEFPPYNVSQVKKKGLGSVKVKKAVDPEGNDITDIAKMYSGLNCNFYSDMKPHSKVVKNFMLIPGSKVLMSNNEQFVCTI